jgi:hypothetical protein
VGCCAIAGFSAAISQADLSCIHIVDSIDLSEHIKVQEALLGRPEHLPIEMKIFGAKPDALGPQIHPERIAFHNARQVREAGQLFGEPRCL